MELKPPVDMHYLRHRWLLLPSGWGGGRRGRRREGDVALRKKFTCTDASIMSYDIHCMRLAHGSGHKC